MMRNMMMTNRINLDLLMAAGFVIAVAIDRLVDDIAVYYALNSLAAISLAYIAIMIIRSTCSMVYGTMMIIQAGICLLLVFDLGYFANNILQYILTTYNSGIELVIIAIGMIASDSGLFGIHNCDHLNSCGGGNWRGSDS